MIVRPNTLIRLVQILFAGILFAGILILLSLLPATKESTRVEARGQNPYSNNLAKEMSGSPNIVSSSMAVAVHEFGRFIDSTAYTIGSSTRTIATTTARMSETTINTTQDGIKSAASGVGKGVVFIGNAVGDGVVYVASIPRNTVSYLSNTSIVRGVIRPSEQVDVPIIDPNSPELQAALVALPPVQATGQASASSKGGPAWPINGQITTEFGVDHWPFQRTHSGMDISDGRSPGITPIKPFRPGKVQSTVYSNSGLGNHVIVDHGSGVTSVYAHLASIAVNIGQEVNLETTLGYEGSTGASTGTHLHFEIRVNGQAANPRQFISGQP